MSLVRFRPEAPYADLAHLVERHLAKVEVAGSSPVIRSILWVRKISYPQLIWRHSQVVRHGSAKPLSPGSNPGDASRMKQPSWVAFFILEASLSLCIAFCELSEAESGSHIRLSDRCPLARHRERRDVFAPRANGGCLCEIDIAALLCYDKIRKGGVCYVRK